MRIIALIFALAAAPAVAQPYADDTDCKTFIGLTLDQQVKMLATIEPFGDDLELADESAAIQWADEVSTACEAHPERLLPDVARVTLGG